MLLSPSVRGLVGVTDQLPSPSALTLITSPVGSVTLTSAFGSVLPSMVGMVSLVILSPLIPVSDDGSSQTLGASGAVVSISREITVGWLGLPAGSVATTVMSPAPSANGFVGVTDQSPFASAVTTMVSPVGNFTVTSAPGSVWPSMVGLVSLVMLSPLTPVSESGSSQTFGDSGAMVSIMTGMTISVWLPAGSCAITLMSLSPSGSD